MKRIKNYTIAAVLALTLISGSLTLFSFKSSSYFEIAKNLDIFATLYKELNLFYVDDVEPGKMIRTGIEAMLESLDPYTNFISEADMEGYRLQTTGKYGGIGATIRNAGNEIIIAEPYENFAAFKAGLLAGDIIVEVEEKDLVSGKSLMKPVAGKTTEDVSKLLKGQPGTTVKLKISRLTESGTRSEMTLELTREEIKIFNVPYFGMVNEHIGYIQLANFTEKAGKEVQDAFDKLKAENKLKGVILDVRGNPGGLLNEAVNVSNVFVEKGKLIVSTKGKVEEWQKSFKTLSSPVDTEIPLVVLTSRGSASASEIVSGAIQDLDRGVVVGQKTFGKGLVQTTRNLSYNTKLKVTTAKYYIPSGRCIQAINYGEREEDGSVGKIPDSLKTAFKTASGRTVYDGGGIDPDIITETETYSQITTSLIRKGLIFDYATLYRAKHSSISGAKEFRLSENDYQGFVAWLENKEYDYVTKTEELLEQFEESAKKEMYYEGISLELEKLRKGVMHDKERDLKKFKEEISQLLEQEIVSRYHYRKGAIEASFSFDKDIVEAVKVLEDKNRYQALLQPSKAGK